MLKRNVELPDSSVRDTISLIRSLFYASVILTTFQFLKEQLCLIRILKVMFIYTLGGNLYLHLKMKLAFCGKQFSCLCYLNILTSMHRFDR